jgi:hypothetical protein
MTIIADTNIVLYFLGGDENLKSVMQDFDIIGPFIVEIELLCYNNIDSSEEEVIREFLKNSIISEYNEHIKSNTIEIRKRYGLKIPDAIIAATSSYLGYPLLSADTIFNRVEEITFLKYSH